MPVKKNMFVLLPPSEGKAQSGLPKTKWSPSQGVFGKALGAHRQAIVTSLHKAQGGSAALLGVSGKHLDRAQSANSSLAGSPTLVACERYTGVVWGHLDLPTLTPTQHSFARDHIVVVSGLLGAVLGSDPTPDYRLKMGARIAVEKHPIQTMSKFWREPVTAALNNLCAGHIVVDVLPQDHRGIFLPDQSLLKGYISVDLVTKSNGKAGGHDAKAAKGLLVRHLFSTPKSLSSVELILDRISSFSHPQFKVVTKVN
ncbi:peroxide stress protein YaaA [bacterium]|nr:peroxide stress protein YaaA [bacterium]